MNLVEEKDLSLSQTIHVKNNIYVLGRPVVAVPTLELLVQALDRAGEQQPIVIISPEATTIPDLSDRLSTLIQNNRRVQPMNVTTEDRYHFMNTTDDELKQLTASITDPEEQAAMLYIYQGIRARSQVRYSLDMSIRERDVLWSRHCANPYSNEGSERYCELVNNLIPQYEAEFNRINTELQRLDAEQAKRHKTVAPVQTSSEVKVSVTATVETATSAAVVSHTVSATGSLSDLYSLWKSPSFLKLPFNLAEDMSRSPAYAEIDKQQKDITVNGRNYKAVPLPILIALGIPTFTDGVPVVYTDNGKFKRVGTADVSPLNLKYWYPTPER